MTRYDQARFRATHNSYSGGARGSFPAQLARGIRFLELDVHDKGYAKVGDYRIGHLKPGSEVALGKGNPDTLLLRDWLGVIATWSHAHPGHAPITIGLDMKGDLTDNDSGGDLEDLNQALGGVFGAKLFTRQDYDERGAWPEVEELHDRFLCVLSGDGSTRAAYRWAFGTIPALAINVRGDVVVTYRAESGDLNCWTGMVEDSGTAVRWRRKMTYGFATLGLAEPAVGITEDRWVVAAHSFGPRPGLLAPQLESVVGRLQDDGRVVWSKGEVFALGRKPSLLIHRDEVREIHVMPDGQRRQAVRGTLNRRRRRVDWSSPRTASADAFLGDAVAWRGHQVRSLVDPAKFIGVAFDGGALQPTRFRQVLFVEEQAGNDPAVFKDALFFAASAKDEEAIARARARGLVTRAWGFEEGDRVRAPSSPEENMPATDTPEVAWYQEYMSGSTVAV